MYNVPLRNPQQIALLAQDQRVRDANVVCFRSDTQTSGNTTRSIKIPSRWPVRLTCPRANLSCNKGNLTIHVSYPLKKILCFFVAADFIVADNMTNFMQLVKTPEATMFYTFQVVMEK